MSQIDTNETNDAIYSAIYDRHASSLFSFLYQQTGNLQDSEDLLVEVFMSAFRNTELPDLPGERQFAWLRTVARNKVIDRYRRTTLFSMHSLELASNREDDTPTPEQHVEKQEELVRLNQCIQQLSPEQQQLLQLRYQRGLKLVEIASMMHKPQGTVRKFLARTLKQLRTIYDQAEKGEA